MVWDVMQWLCWGAGDVNMLGFYGISVVIFVLQSVGSLVTFVIYVVRTLFWWLCEVDECGFGCLIVVLFVVPKCGLVLVVSMERLRG